MSGKKVLVIAPHPDDETLGVGGTLLKHKKNGDQIFWLILTTVNSHPDYADNFAQSRSKLIDQISSLYDMQSTFQLSFLAAKLDQYPLNEIIFTINKIFTQIQPNIIYLPFAFDAHSDHRVAYKATTACSKSFRNPLIEEISMYETLSETNFSLTFNCSFNPNIFVNITETFEKKLEILEKYKDELGMHPFPRSIESIHALAKLRGSQSNYHFAESFMLLKRRC